jgi:dTDP-4-amino-4,6-dideoxygalactose transaminase
MPAYSVPYTALATEAAQLKDELMGAVESVLDSGRYVMGKELSSFEGEFAEFCEAKFAVGVSSGTAALHLVLSSLNLNEGDEVITAPNSFVASAATIALAGGKPVFSDISEDGNIDPEKLEDAITPFTRAIVPVHLTGRPAKMAQILEIAHRHDLFVLEDAAQALGATLDGKPVGTWGHAAAFSLHPLKNLHAVGDGGMVTSQDPKMVTHLGKSRNHGLADRERCDFWSFNCRLDELQAAMLRIQLRQLADWTEARHSLALRYNDLLRPYVEVPDEGPGEHCVYQTYVVKTDRRDELKQYLNDNGVEALVHYATPIHLQPAAADLGYTLTDFPQTMKHVGKIISLPLYPSLTHHQQDQVVDVISSFQKNN